MKHLLFLAVALPLLSFGQTKPKTKATAAKKATTIKKPAVKKDSEEKSADGFLIKGKVTGYPDGTTVALLNGQTGAPEADTKLVNSSFSFKGKVENPDFKIILLNNQQPYITLFLDNSLVTINASKDAPDKAVIKGSASHDEYNVLISSLEPYQYLFGGNAPYDSVALAKMMAITTDFVKGHSNSFIAPLAIIRYSQVSDNVAVTENLYNTLSPEVKASPMAAYVGQQLAEAKKYPVGSVLEDFTQEDTTGKAVSLTSLRGKYVLIDFWASWCRPCRQENPNVVANYNKYKSKNFTVLGVSLDKTKDAWVDAINADGLAWQHVSDLQGWTNAVAQQFGITSIPQNFLIGPDGKIIGKNLRGPALERKLDMLLK